MVLSKCQLLASYKSVGSWRKGETIQIRVPLFGLEGNATLMICTLNLYNKKGVFPLRKKIILHFNNFYFGASNARLDQHIEREVGGKQIMWKNQE